MRTNRWGWSIRRDCMRNGLQGQTTVMGEQENKEFFRLIKKLVLTIWHLVWLLIRLPFCGCAEDQGLLSETWIYNSKNLC